MPAKDRYHDVVVRALKKDGWTIVGEQVTLSMPARRLWVDIRALKESAHIAIMVEVKGFENMSSPVQYLADAIGQCVLYQTILEYAGMPDQLYMAVPAAAFAGILGEEIGRQAMHKAHASVIVFDPEQEEIMRWIP